MRAMKDSGVEWIEEIPEDWNLVRTKAFFNAHKEIVGDRVDAYERLALTLKGVIKRSKEDIGGLQPEQFASYQILKKNNLVFKLIDLENVNTSRVGLSPYTGIVSPAYIVLENNNEDNRFYYYWFISMYYNEVFNHIGGDGVRSALNAKELLNIPLPNIQSDEQQRIADYLDAKCSKIDAIISKQEAVIEKLKAYKQSIITEAVTKGLNPDVEMKDSGIEWIGKMPKHWKCVPIKRLCEMQAGDTLKSEQIADEGIYPVYGGNGLRGYFNSFNTEGERLLVGRQGALCGNVHMVNGEYWATEHAVVTTPNKRVNIIFLYYLLIGADLNRYSNSAAQPGLAVSTIVNVKVTLPPIEEQHLIAKTINNIDETIDKVISRKQSVIDKLTEYKKSLIYEVVTGKKEV